MTDRFRQRQSEHGWGVWDHAVNGWYGRQDLSEDEAIHAAAVINSKVRRRPPVAPGSRQVNPPKPVVVHIRELYKEATLDWWVREKDGWHGRVKYSISGKSEWVHVNNIRETT